MKVAFDIIHLPLSFYIKCNKANIRKKQTSLSSYVTIYKTVCSYCCALCTT